MIDLTTNQLLPRAAKNWPDKTALICQNKELFEKINYKNLFEKALLCAKKYLDLKISKGDRVIIYYENSIEFYCAYFGLWHIGAIAIPLNVHLSDQEISNIIFDAAPKAIIVSNTLNEKLSPDINNIIIINDIPEIISKGSRSEINRVEQNHEDTVVILYTSGTTGTPKGVMLSSKNIISNINQGLTAFNFDYTDIVYCPLPLFHSLPQNMCMWAPFMIGATAITVSKVDRITLVKAFEHNPTIIVTVPAMYGLFLKLRNLDFSKYRYCFSGGDVLPDKIQKYFELVYRRKISNGFGMTETSPFIAVNSNEWTTAISNVGKPFPGISAEVRGDNGEVLPKNTIGTLWVKGDNIMKGYYNAPEATNDILKNGWLNTGDLCYINNNDEIVLSGRAKDLIINKGVKIYPQEIETILYKNSDVLQVAVIGKKDSDSMDEIPIAFIGTNANNIEALEQELKNLCEQYLATYKIPRKFVILRELPMTATGKIDKKGLRNSLN